ncbi:MAG: hypothetical protein R3C05_10615 [Pirellulaceae bacterium]
MKNTRPHFRYGCSAWSEMKHWHRLKRTSSLPTTRRIVAVGVQLLVAVLFSRVTVGDETLYARVPPTMEIEVIDPGVDARGNPAVQLHPMGSGTIVDIPPTVLVHRYYYTGDRSFRGPNLPGGPSIVVASHPKTGERTYVPVQLLPGSPMVHYTSGGIEFDYGDYGIKVVFPCFCEPKTKIRTGRRIADQVSDALCLDELKQLAEPKIESRVSPAKRVGIAAEGVLLYAKDAVQPVTQPAIHILRMVPGVVALTDPNTEIENARRVREHNLETARKIREHRTLLDDLDRSTIR